MRQNNDSTSEIVSGELRLVRTILERLECSFARQEAKLDRQGAKLDRLLDMMNSQTAAPQMPQCPPQVSVQPHSITTPFSITSAASSVEFPLTPVMAPRQQEMSVDLHLFDEPDHMDSAMEIGK